MHPFDSLFGGRPLRWKLLLMAGLLFFSQLCWAIPRNTRHEMFRYTLLRDRVLAERAIKGIHKQNYFSFDIHISDGLKSFLGDLRGTYQDNTIDSDTRTARVEEILNQHLNTEYFLDIDGQAGIPLPDIRIKKFTFHPSLFGGYNGGGSISVTNASGGTKAQVYIKVESRAGINVLAKLKEPFFADVSFYHMNRKDDFRSKSSEQIAISQTLAGFDGLNNEQNSQRFDLTLGMQKKKHILTASVDELILKRTRVSPEYGNYPYIKLQYQGHIKKDALLIEPYGGIHRRARYAIHKGLYGAVKVEKMDFPFKAMTMLDPEMFTLSLRFEYKLFRAAYTLKLPHQNPVDNVWVPKINSLMINVSF